MDRVAKETIGKKGRYILSDFDERLRKDLAKETFQTAQQEIYEHVCELVEKAFLSKGKADVYQLPIE